MRRVVFALASAVFAFAAVTAFAAEPSPKPPRPALKPYDDDAVAFTHVNVVAMLGNNVLEDRTVVVRRGRITVLGAARDMRLRPGTLVVDGEGRYLIPGLSDMHMHLPYGDEGKADIPAVLTLNVVNGVTTVLNLLGLPEHLEAREKVAKAELLGPTIWTSGFWINEPFVKTADEVEAKILEQKAAGYDVIKLHGDMSREAYHRAIEVARREGMPVVGHLPRNLGVDVALEEKQDVVAHAEEYLYAHYLFGGKSCCGASFDDDTRTLAAATAKAGTWLIPTLKVFKGIPAQIDNMSAVLGRSEAAYVPRSIFKEWENNRYRDRTRAEIPQLENLFKIQQHLVLRMKEAGVRMMVGTDAPANAAVAPGFSIHDELEEMVAAGFTPYEALRAATIEPAKWRGDIKESGSIEMGKRGDLVLLEANPLLDIAATRKRVGVLIRGRWIPAKEADQMLAKLKRN